MTKAKKRRTRNAIDLAVIPGELIERVQWVAWRFEERDGKPAKIPINPTTGNRAKSDDPTSWGAYRAAIRAVRRFVCAGVGFVFSDADPYSGVDIDDCRSPRTGIIKPWARRIIASLDSYTEISPSQTGVKIWVRATLGPDARKRTAYRDGGIEMYSRRRFFTVTGNHFHGTPTTIKRRQEQLEALHSRIFGEKVASQNAVHPVRVIEAIEPDDAALLARARRAANGAKFAKLWRGDFSEYSSQSEADLALCGMLAFWTGNDAARIDRVFRQSGLMRNKWARPDYRQCTIAAACRTSIAVKERRRW